MNRSHLSRRAWAVTATTIAVAGLAGCGLIKINENVQGIVDARLIGMQTGVFFDRYGGARPRSTGSDGAISYEWVSEVPYAMAGPSGLDDRICRLRLSADPRGKITGVQIVYDAPGTKSTSRCGEIFAAA